MNTYEKLRELRNKILYPYGVPLEFGCETEEGIYIGEELITSNHTAEWKHTVLHNNGRILGQNYVAKILGKPITLQDILRVINRAMFDKKTKLKGYELSYCGDSLYIHWTDSNDYQDYIKILLEKEIKNQDEEVLQQIINLIEPSET